MIELHIFPQKARLEAGSVCRTAVLWLAGQYRHELWYRFPEEYADWITQSADPFLVACVLMAMRESADIVVHGRVSPSLIANLYEFQAAWHSWRPRKYDLVEIRADEESEILDEASPRGAVCAFTGGVDSSYSIYRHRKGLCGKAQRTIAAGLFVNGFDIPLDQPEAFERAAGHARSTLKTLDVELLTVTSNHKELNPEWDDTHGIGIASSLMFFAPRFSEGMIASTHSYTGLKLPWGSNPITDPLLSSHSFGIVHDGAGCSRVQKYLTVSRWPEAYSNLRVCFSAEERDKNCGRCAKCIATQVSMRRLQLPVPLSFECELTENDILSMRNATDSEMEALQTALDGSVRPGSNETSLVSALQRCVRYNQIKKSLSARSRNPLKEKIRQLRLRAHEYAGP